MRRRAWILTLGLVLVASVGVARWHHQRGPDAADRAGLTTSEYDRAVTIARSTRDQQDGTLTAAIAYVVPGRVQQRNLDGRCDSGQVLVVVMAGGFPHIQVDPAPGAPTGPDMWVVVKADPVSGAPCVLGVGLGHFHPRAGSANLLPAL